MIFHENLLAVDNSHEISCLICCFGKAAKMLSAANYRWQFMGYIQSQILELSVVKWQSLKNCKNWVFIQNIHVGVQWLSGRVLDSRQRGSELEPHRRHCIVSLSKNINLSLVLVQPRKTRPYITERLLMGRKESNQTNKTKYIQEQRYKEQDCHFDSLMMLKDRFCIGPVYE